MASKRRLSSGSNAGLGAIDDADSDEDFDMEEDNNVKSKKSGGRRSTGSRRRSSFGGAFQSTEEQARIAAMYSNVIKMSSENVRKWGKKRPLNKYNLDKITYRIY